MAAGRSLPTSCPRSCRGAGDPGFRCGRQIFAGRIAQSGLRHCMLLSPVSAFLDQRLRGNGQPRMEAAYHCQRQRGRGNTTSSSPDGDVMICGFPMRFLYPARQLRSRFSVGAALVAALTLSWAPTRGARTDREKCGLPQRRSFQILEAGQKRHWIIGRLYKSPVLIEAFGVGRDRMHDDADDAHLVREPAGAGNRIA